MANIESQNLIIKALKAQLPHNWLQILKLRTGRGFTYLSRMVNNYQTERKEWQEVIELAKEHQETLAKTKEENEKQIAKILA